MLQLRIHTVFVFILIGNLAFTQKRSHKSEAKKIKGHWVYSHSFNEDTSLVLKIISSNSDYGKLAKEYIFEKDSLSDTNKVNLYRGLVCKIPDGQSFASYYPLAFDFSTHEFKERLDIILFYDRKKSLKFHWFLIESIDNELMYLSDERYYEQDQETFVDFTHVYKKEGKRKKR